MNYDKLRELYESNDEVLELIDDVRRMRNWQKKFFKSKSSESLMKSKENESIVDKTIREIGEPRLF